MFGQYFLIIYVIVQILISILTEYVITKNYHYKKFGRKTRIIRIILYIWLALMPVLGAYLPKCGFKYFCLAAGNLWLGFFIYFAALTVILTLVMNIIALFTKDKERMILRHTIDYASVIAAIILIIGLFHAQNIKTLNYEVKINKEVEDIDELRVVLISDLHLSVNSYLKTTEYMVEKVNEIDADIVLIGGDVFTSNYKGLRHPEKYAKALSMIKSKYGTYAVYGNHDVEEELFSGFAVSPVSEAFRTKEMEDFFKASGFNVLYDENVELCDGKIVLVGRVDGEKAGDGTSNRMPADELLKDVDKTKPVIVLEHEPVEYRALAKNGADLVLSGHTHNGQMFPGNLIVPYFNENAFGLKTIDGMDTIVSAGTGYYGPPMRLGTDADITVINITFQ